MTTAVQQIMLGGVTGNESAAREALSRVRAAGYDAVELNRFMIHPSGPFVRLLTRMAGMPVGSGGRLDWFLLVKDSGLDVVSLHTDLGSLEREPDAVVGDAMRFGTSRVVVTGMYRFDYGDEKSVLSLAGRLNEAGGRMKAAGLRLLYHNHNAELLRVREGMTAFALLLAETDPSLVGIEFDSYWFAEAGADPAAWMKKLGRRMELWHVTDRGVMKPKSHVTPILKSDVTEAGQGSMELDRLAGLAEENGCAAAVLETHRNWAGSDPLKSVEISARWMTGRFGR